MYARTRPPFLVSVVCNALAFIIAGTVLITSTGCATIKPIAINTATCSAEKIAPLVPSAMPSVAAILSNSAISDAEAQAQLEQLGLSAGLDVVECAIAAVVNQLQAGGAVPPAAALAVIHPAPATVQLARAYKFQAAHATANQ